MRLLIFSSLLLLQCAYYADASTYFRMTNLKCEAFDKPFAEFSVCRLNVPSRNKIIMNLHVVLHQVLVNNVTLNMALLKKASGYRPFMYNYTVDFCQFMANQRRNPFLKILFDVILKDSNLNHTCPYNHDIILKNLVFTEDDLKLLPLPLGEYMIHAKVAVKNDWKVDVKVYFKNFESL